MRNPFRKITETRIGTRKYTDHSATNLELPVNQLTCMPLDYLRKPE